MKLFLSALLSFALLPLRAQQTPSANPPAGNAPGFPFNMFSQPDAFMKLRSEAPFRAVVVKGGYLRSVMEWHYSSMSPEGRPFGDKTGHHDRVKR